MPEKSKAMESEVECPTPLAAIGAKQQRTLAQNTAVPRGAPCHADGLDVTIVMARLDVIPTVDHQALYE